MILPNKEGINFYETPRVNFKTWRGGVEYSNVKNELVELFWTMQDVGLVYIVDVGLGHYKIGMTTNIRQRFMTFRRSNPFVNDHRQLVALIEPWRHSIHRWTEDSRRVEKIIHWILRDKRREGTEIFCLQDEDLEMLYAELQKNMELPNANKKGDYIEGRHRAIRAILPRPITETLLRTTKHIEDRHVDGTKCLRHLPYDTRPQPSLIPAMQCILTEGK
jgi:hypothetical protein